MSRDGEDTRGAFVDQEARDMARSAEARIEKHEAVCAERYENINTTLAELKSKIASSTAGLWNRIWIATGALIILLLGVIGWLINKAFG